MKRCFLYALVCTVNGKLYIGVSSSPLDRLARHRCCAAGGDRRKLYRAMRKHGSDSFRLLMLRTGTEAEMFALEIGYIARFDTMRCGYNSTPGGDGVDGEAARRGRRKGLETNRKNGWKHQLENMRKVHARRSRPCIAAGQRYPSRAAAALALGKTSGTISWLVRNGALDYRDLSTSKGRQG